MRSAVNRLRLDNRRDHCLKALYIWKPSVVVMTGIYQRWRP